jgi:type IV pilus assembly protein PilB
MVGEIRDNETAALAVNASLTGHVVVATLHTNSAAGAVPRLIDMKVEPFLIVSTINIVIAQRLVRKLSDQKEKYFLSKAEIATLGKSVNMDKVLEALKEEKVVAKTDDWEKIPFCRLKKDVEPDDGYHGRIGIHEIMKVSPAIKEIILKSGTADSIQVQAEKEGMLTMIEDGMFKCVQGLTTIEEVLRVISE